MKKRTMAVGGLLLAVAMTGYSVAGTYAKYISQVDLTDEARVAKWGFNITDEAGNAISNNKIDLFAQSYSTDKNAATDADVYVKSVDSDKVVAPGTTGTYTFKLAGEMETRYLLKFEVNSVNDFVVYYSTKTEGGETVVDKDKLSITPFDGAIEYRPLRYTVSYVRGTGSDIAKEDVKNVTAKQLEAALNAYNNNHPTGFQPGEMNQQYTISWKWDVRNTDDGSGNTLTADMVDVLDTFAGQHLSTSSSETGGVKNPGSNITFGVKVTAEQVTNDLTGTDN